MGLAKGKHAMLYLRAEFGTPNKGKTKELMTPLEWRIFCKHRQLMK